MTLCKDCKCPCHRGGQEIIHVVPCCGLGSDRVLPKYSPKCKKEKFITLFSNQKTKMTPGMLPDKWKLHSEAQIYCFVFHKSIKSFAVAGPCPAE